MNKIVCLYSPFPNTESAHQAAETLLSEKLIACANIFPASSTYFWQGDLCNEGEYILFAKTMEFRVKAAVNRFSELHPYEVPCILRLDGQVNEAYFAWMKDTLSD